MYVFLDKKGVVKEIVSDTPLRVGNEESNVIYVYFEDLVETIDGVNFYILKNGASESVLKVGEKVVTYIPYERNHDLKYFQYEKDYIFYKLILTADLLDISGLLQINAVAVIKTINLVSGLILLNVEDSVVRVTSDITISEYEYIKNTLATLAASEYDNVVAFLGEIPSNKKWEENKVILNVLGNGKIKFYIQKENGLEELASTGSNIIPNVTYLFNAPQLSSLKIDDVIYQVPTKDYVQSMVSGVVNNAYIVVESLPPVGVPGAMYLVGVEPPYDMYIFEGTNYINLGTTSVNLSDYYTIEETNATFATIKNLSNYVLVEVAEEKYATKEEIKILQPKLVSGVNIATINNETILGPNNNFNLVDTLTYESDKGSIANGFVYENSSDKLYLAKDTNKLGVGIEFKTINGTPIIGAGRINTLTFKTVEIVDSLTVGTIQGVITEGDYSKLLNANTTTLKIVTNDEWNEIYFLKHSSNYTDMTATEHLVYSGNIFKMVNNEKVEFSLIYDFTKTTEGGFAYTRTLSVVMTLEIIKEIIENEIANAKNS